MSPVGFTLFTGRVWWRYFVTGREITGPGDNATFFHDATMDRGYPLMRPYQVLTRARWRRVARRNALIGVPATLLGLETLADIVEAPANWLDLTPPAWTGVPWFDLLQGYAGAGTLAASVIVVPKIRAAHAIRKPAKEFIYPSVQVATKILGVPYRKRDALHMLDLPKNWGQGTEEIPVDAVMPRLFLPAVPLDAAVKKRIVANVGARLGIPNPEGDWQEVGGRAHVTFRAFPLPPVKLDAAKVMPAIEAADVSHPVIGFAQGHTPVALDYEEESPHVLGSGGSGTGKSTLARLILAKRMAKGNGLIVLDYKRVSHIWAHDMDRDRARYFYKIDEIHDALVMIDVELTHRMHGPVELLGTHRPVDILIEELNSLTAMLRVYWREKRSEIKRQNAYDLKLNPESDVTEPPLLSPAIQAIANVTNLGRQVLMFAHVFGQRVSANALGANGGDIRENFQSRMIAKWTRKTWAMLTDVPYIVCPSGPRGIWALVQGDKVSIVRVPYVSDEEARTLALSGPEPMEPILSSVSGQRRTIEGETVQVDRLAAVRGVRVSLSEAADTVRLTLNALQVASKRADEFPAPAEVGGPGKPNKYDLAELIEWREKRDGIQLELGPGDGS
jgi:hypothetical protein